MTPFCKNLTKNVQRFECIDWNQLSPVIASGPGDPVLVPGCRETRVSSVTVPVGASITSVGAAGHSFTQLLVVCRHGCRGAAVIRI